MTVCKHVYYGGHVQGVGFRYTTRGLAEGFPVTGYVRNLPGGDVEVVVQGESDHVEAFLAALAGRMADYIDKTTVQDAQPGSYRDFSIRY